jgi:carboxylesterase type B
MFSIVKILALGAILAVTAFATPFNPRPFDSLLSKRQSSPASKNLVVDLGYEQYQGVANSSTGLNTWRGIRYAAPPTGQLRWQAPHTPAVNRGQVISADAYPHRCPQAPDSPLPPNYNFTGNEDCLFLSVYAPPNATNVPLLVWIHGGGYGAGQGNEDLTPIINTNNNNFIGVAIQYRLGAFGFMSSDEIHRFGVVNAGLLDQTFAL